MAIGLQNIVMDFPGSRALDNVSAKFGFDEVHGLIGENGAGKSTLMSILAGVRPPTGGRLEFDGKPVRFGSPREALEHGIALVSQEGSLVPALTGAENILLGDEPRFLGGMLRRGALMARARKLLDDWFPGVDIALDKPVDALDVADRKVIEIVRGLRSDVRLLILDEPTATLPSREKQRLWDIIRSLPEKGVGVILISHFLSEVLALSDRITVLRGGRNVGTYDKAEMSEGRMVDLMLRRTGGTEGLLAARESFARADEAPALLVRNWRVGRVTVPEFALRRGEVVGLIGLTGAGHFGFARSLYTRSGVLEGEVEVAGKPVNRASVRAMQKGGVAFVPDHRMENALMADGTIAENLSMVHPEVGSRLPGTLSPSLERREAQRVMSLLDVRATGPAQTIKTLSGGNKQKVSLGKWLYGAADQYVAMIFVEPTEGVDVGAKQEIYGHIRRLAQSGVGVLIASSDLLEIEQVTDRVIPFYGHRPGPEISSEDYSEARFISAMAGEAA